MSYLFKNRNLIYHERGLPVSKLFEMAEQEKSLATTKRIFDLYRKYGGEDYIGESVSQTEHMIQCAMLAEKENFSDEVILGALFHDIGHLIGFEEHSPQMGDYGTEKHEMIGEKFLADLGFPESVTKMVGGHVDAKRYLVYKYEDFYEKVLKNSNLIPLLIHLQSHDFKVFFSIIAFL